MMTSDPMFAVASSSDADLVERSLRGDSGAFSSIVSRYQALVCSLTYNATGSLSRSEDLAQEVFLTAWKELRQLREPTKVRAWLCGIARRLTANTIRREVREPVCAADELVDEHQSPAPDPAAQAITSEEEEMLWRALGQIPETYREPMILFYREDQSVAHVAESLGLSEDAAKQRLSRGRKMLQEQLALFVESALRQSTPGRAFTLGVLAALPMMTTTATAATLGSTAVKGAAAAKGVSLLAVLSVLIGPVVGCLGGWFGMKASLDSAQSEPERELIRRYSRQLVGLVLGFLVLMGLAMPFEAGIWREHSTVAIVLGATLPTLYVAVLTVMILRFKRAHARLIAAEAPR